MQDRQDKAKNGTWEQQFFTRVGLHKPMLINEGGTAEDTMPFVPCFTARDEKAFFITRKKFLMEFLKEVFQMVEKTMEKS